MRDFPMSDPGCAEGGKFVGSARVTSPLISFPLICLRLIGTKSAESTSHITASERCVSRTAGRPESRPEKEKRHAHRNRTGSGRIGRRIAGTAKKEDRGSQAEGCDSLENQEGSASASTVLGS